MHAAEGRDSAPAAIASLGMTRCRLRRRMWQRRRRGGGEILRFARNDCLREGGAGSGEVRAGGEEGALEGGDVDGVDVVSVGGGLGAEGVGGGDAGGLARCEA